MCSLSTAEIVKSNTLNQTSTSNKKEINSNYLISKGELNDYIFDKGDSLFIKFYPAEELSGLYSINEEGEIYLPRLKRTNVRGLTIPDLEKLLEEKYSEFLVSPNIEINIAIFRKANISVSGEVRYPGIYKFNPYESASIDDFEKSFNSKTSLETSGLSMKQNFSVPSSLKNGVTKSKNISPTQNRLINRSSNSDKNNKFVDYFEKKEEGNLIKISDVIRKAGGITPLSDLGQIQVMRDVPISQGGGKKVAVINLNTILDNSDTSNDIRLFDGDHIIIPSLSIPSKVQVPKSVLTGLSPRFVQVMFLVRWVIQANSCFH